MATATSSIAQMIVQYEWILENVDEKPRTFASKMILFRGERVFRVGLKNHTGGDEPPVLFVMAVTLNKMGMKVKEVRYGIQDSGIDGPEKMIEMAQENIGDVRDKGSFLVNCGVLQLFTIELAKKVIGTCTFVFRICIEGSVPGYSYCLSDRLAKDQLWAAAKNQNWADVEFVVKGKTFSAHKAILAARSPIFKAEFTKEQPEKNLQIKIDDVDPSTVEQFLHFIYTGESMGMFANEELFKLALRYQLTTLGNLCEVALKKIKPIHMVNLDRKLNKESEILTSSIIR
jgi:speckle-type POZ protein